MNQSQTTLRSGEIMPLLDGTNDHLVFSRAHWNKLIAVANIILQNPDWVVTDHGIISRPGGGSTSSTSLRGEYDSATVYNFGDLVVISTGPNQGTYVYINKTGSSGNDPWVGGGYWLQLPGGLSNSWI